MRVFFSFIFFITSVSFGQIQPENNLYICKEVGWKINVPSGWNITNESDTTKTEGRGHQMLTSVLGKEPQYGPGKDLIEFYKDPFNSFSSTIELFGNVPIKDWEKRNKTVNLVTFKAVQNQGVKCDSSSYIESIDSLKFNVFKIRVYKPNGELFLTQVIYSTLINKYDFGAILCYNNDIDRRILFDSWRKSKFAK